MAKPVTFAAVGDIGFWKGTCDSARRRVFDWAFERMKPVLAEADLVFGNMESVVVPSGFPKKQIDPDGLVTTFDGRAIGEALRRAGFDVMNLAANHVLDAG